MRLTLHTEQAVDHLVPQRTRGDSLSLQNDAGRDLEPVVAQHGADEVVGEHFWPQRTDCDGRLPLRFLEAGINSRGRLVDAVAQRGQIGVENTRWSGTDGHDGLSFDAS